MNLGLPEMLVIFFIALLLFGPKKLPEIGRTIGKAMSEFRRAADELKNSLEREVDLDLKGDLQQINRDIKDVRGTVNDLRRAVPSMKDFLDPPPATAGDTDARSGAEHSPAGPPGEPPDEGAANPSGPGSAGLCQPPDAGPGRAG